MGASIVQKSAGRCLAGCLCLLVLGIFALIGSTGEENENSSCICDCNVTFCRQYNDYGSANASLDDNSLTIECIQGPEGSTLSNRMNGTYYVSGRYRIAEPGVTIALGWNGETIYEFRENFTVSQAGEGRFVVKAGKKEGGVGLMYLSVVDAEGMSLFFTRVEDTDCDA